MIKRVNLMAFLPESLAEKIFTAPEIGDHPVARKLRNPVAYLFKRNNVPLLTRLPVKGVVVCPFAWILG